VNTYGSAIGYMFKVRPRIERLLHEFVERADVADPAWRGAALGVYRLWRDLGFAVGAVVTGVLAQVAGMQFAITAIAVLTAASGAVVLVRMRETRPAGDA